MTAHSKTTTAVVRKPRHRAVNPRVVSVRLDLIIPECVPSPCVAQDLDVPGRALACNKRGPLGLANGTRDALAIQSLRQTPGVAARHHRGHLWHDRDAGARTVVLPGLGRTRYG